MAQLPRLLSSPKSGFFDSSIISSSRLEVLIHLLLWLLLFSLPLAFLPDTLQQVQGVYWMVYSHQALLCTAFYFNYLFLTPIWLEKKKLLGFLLGVVGIVAIVITVNMLIRDWFDLDQQYRDSLNLPQNYQHLPGIRTFPTLSTLVILAISTVLRSNKMMQKQAGLRMKEQEERLTTELRFLKSQISPHYLFNTLNTIYALTETNTQEARSAIHMLSKQIRYLLYETDRSYTTLSAEIQFLNDYIRLMRLRLPDHVTINFDQETPPKPVRIPPMLFLHFVENSFKHGISNRQASDLQFSLRFADGQVFFKASNPMHQQLTEPGGVGLSNTLRRLNLLYPEHNYQLHVSPGPHFYTVDLSIPVYED
ncbi:MAG: sensor histidine kinase [Salibacteraceae bacterium]